MQTFPPEIISHIFFEVGGPARFLTELPGLPDLLNCALVCSTWHHLARRVIFGTIVVEVNETVGISELEGLALAMETGGQDVCRELRSLSVVGGQELRGRWADGAAGDLVWGQLTPLITRVLNAGATLRKLELFIPTWTLPLSALTPCVLLKELTLMETGIRMDLTEEPDRPDFPSLHTLHLSHVVCIPGGVKRLLNAPQLRNLYISTLIIVDPNAPEDLDRRAAFFAAELADVDLSSVDVLSIGDIPATFVLKKLLYSCTELKTVMYVPYRQTPLDEASQAARDDAVQTNMRTLADFVSNKSASPKLGDLHVIDGPKDRGIMFSSANFVESVIELLGALNSRTTVHPRGCLVESNDVFCFPCAILTAIKSTQRSRESGGAKA